MTWEIRSGPECIATQTENILEEFAIETPDDSSHETATIRRYQPSDRDAVRRICCDTGYLGRPIDGIYCDRKLYADLLTRPYLDYEPDWALVAEVKGRVVGYLLGSVSRKFERLLMWCGFQTASQMLWKLAARRYATHPRSERFVRWVLTAGFWERPKHPDAAAHLHFDLERPYRGRALGRRLWETYERKLAAAGVARYYGEFFSYPGRRPECVYARYGFREYDRCRTTLYRSEIPAAVDVVCVQKNLDGRA